MILTLWANLLCSLVEVNSIWVRVFAEIKALLKVGGEPFFDKKWMLADFDGGVRSWAWLRQPRYTANLGKDHFLNT